MRVLYLIVGGKWARLVGCIDCHKINVLKITLLCRSTAILLTCVGTRIMCLTVGVVHFSSRASCLDFGPMLSDSSQNPTIIDVSTLDVRKHALKKMESNCHLIYSHHLVTYIIRLVIGLVFFFYLLTFSFSSCLLYLPRSTCISRLLHESPLPLLFHVSLFHIGKNAT